MNFKIISLLSVLILNNGCSLSPTSVENQQNRLSDDVFNAIAACSMGYSKENSASLKAQLLDAGLDVTGELSKTTKGEISNSQSVNGEQWNETYRQYLECIDKRLLSEKKQPKNITQVVNSKLNSPAPSRNGLMMYFVPLEGGNLSKHDGSFLGESIDKSNVFRESSFLTNSDLAKYGSMEHGLLWKGKFNAFTSGSYLFSVRGGIAAYYKSCNAEIHIDGREIVSFSGNLSNIFKVQEADLEKGDHQMEVWLACNWSNSINKNTFVALEVKRPGENKVSSLKHDELTY